MKITEDSVEKLTEYWQCPTSPERKSFLESFLQIMLIIFSWANKFIQKATIYSVKLQVYKLEIKF